MTSSDKPGTAAETAAPRRGPAVAARDWAGAAADPQYRAAVVDLLGALAYGELAAFERLAEDAKLAPTLADKAELAKMASAEFHHFERLGGGWPRSARSRRGRWSRSSALRRLPRQRPLGLAGGAGQGVRRRLHRQ
ncbi:hypothetical protein SBADM41S_06810 [Streptomyces badius]